MLLRDDDEVSNWLDAIGASDATPSQIAKRSGLKYVNVWASLNRGRVTDEAAIKIAKGFGVDALTAISLATGIPHKDLATPPRGTEVAALIYPPSLIEALEDRWSERPEGRKKQQLLWAPSATISSAAAKISGLNLKIELLAERLRITPTSVRLQLRQPLKIRTAIAAAEVASSSYALFLLATNEIWPDTYGLEISAAERWIEKMSTQDLAAVTLTAVSAFAQVVKENVDPEVSAYW